MATINFLFRSTNNCIAGSNMDLQHCHNSNDDCNKNSNKDGSAWRYSENNDIHDKDDYFNFKQ